MEAEEHVQKLALSWPGSSVGGRVIPICQGLRFHPRSGHIRESPMNTWRAKQETGVFLSLSQIDTLKNVKLGHLISAIDLSDFLAMLCGRSCHR